MQPYPIELHQCVKRTTEQNIIALNLLKSSFVIRGVSTALCQWSGQFLHMRIVFLLVVIFCLGIEKSFAQSENKKEDSKELKQDKKSIEKKKKTQSVGEVAQESGKRIWENVKGLFGSVVEELVDKKEKFTRDKNKPTEKEKPKKKQPPKKNDN